MIRVTATTQDWNGDLVYDQRTVAQDHYDAGGKLVYATRDVDMGVDGTVDQRFATDYTYNAAGQLFQEYRATDNWADGVVDYQQWTTYDYNANGSLNWTMVDSPDFSGDGQPDWRTSTTFKYNDAGQLTAKEAISYQDGVFGGLDYRLDSYTYDSKGRLAEYLIDDWVNLDFDIAYKFAYNSANQVINIKVMDEYAFGDSKWHNEETFKYAKNGVLTEHNKYAETMNGMYVLEDKAKLYYNADGSLQKEVHTGQNGSWKTITGFQDEYWYDSQGRETHQLTSFDINGDGKYEAGTRTLEITQYDETGAVSANYIDHNAGADGFTEFVMDSYLIA